MNWIANALFAVAPAAEVATQSEMDMLWHHLLLAIVFSVVGVVVFAISLVVIEKITPFSIVKEIGEEHNMAVAIVVAGIVLGISIIIGASILG